MDLIPNQDSRPQLQMIRSTHLMHLHLHVPHPLPRSGIDSALLLSVLYATFGNKEIYLGSPHPGSSGVEVPIAVSGGLAQRYFLHVACGRCMRIAPDVLVAFHEMYFI